MTTLNAELWKNYFGHASQEGRRKAFKRNNPSSKVETFAVRPALDYETIKRICEKLSKLLFYLVHVCMDSGNAVKFYDRGKNH